MITSVNDEHHDILIYHHERFHREDPELCKTIVRTSRKRTSKQRSSEQRRRVNERLRRASVVTPPRDDSDTFEATEPQEAPEEVKLQALVDEPVTGLSVLAVAADTMDCCSLPSIDSAPLWAEPGEIDGFPDDNYAVECDPNRIPSYVIALAITEEDNLDCCSLSSQDTAPMKAEG